MLNEPRIVWKMTCFLLVTCQLCLRMWTCVFVQFTETIYQSGKLFHYRLSYICCLYEIVNDSPLVYKVFPIFIHRKIVWNCRWSWRRWSIRGLLLWESVWTASPLLHCHPLHSSDLLDHICETLVTASQIHTRYHKVL